jgi:flagella basal body P-ring formation protein FlgA
MTRLRKAKLAQIALLGLLCCMQGAPAMAEAVAVLKLQVQLDSGVIKVADLWTGAGAKGDMVVGPSPPPGRSIAIESSQLAYIARLYDVNWRPLSGAERTAVERAGRPLTREEVAEPIRRSLIEAGAAPNSAVDLANFAATQVPPLAFPSVSVEAIGYEQGSERFSANIAIASEGMATQRMRVAGRVTQMVSAVVANRRLNAGEVIVAADVRIARIPERRLANPVLSDLDLAVGQAPKRTMVAGQPLAAADLGPPVMISKGQTVVMTVEVPGLSMALQGLAMSPGGRDDIIQVMNPLSRAVVAARVTSPGRAVIAPGSSPLVAPGGPSRNPEVAN